MLSMSPKQGGAFEGGPPYRQSPAEGSSLVRDRRLLDYRKRTFSREIR